MTSAILLAVLSAAAARAQEARLNGRRHRPDRSDPGQRRRHRNQAERNVTFSTTGPDGRYLFPRLPIGAYTLKAEHAGFKAFTQSGIPLTTDTDALLNIRMEIGDMAEKVTIGAEASRVSTETATVRQLINSARIVDLPLNGRNIYSLARLAPGAGEGGVNIGGGRSGSQNSAMVNVRVDGALNVDNVFQTALPLPCPDAVQELTIQTSVPSAKYGFASGVIEVSTRSGSNEFQGSLYEFFRNDALDVRSFFNPQRNKRKRNPYGFAGGPVLLPKIYNGRNRTFWFVNAEQQKEPLSATTIIFVPTQGRRSGDFSEISRVIRDPFTNQPRASPLISLRDLGGQPSGVNSGILRENLLPCS